MNADPDRQLRWVLALVLMAGGLAAWASTGYFGRSFLAEIALWAIVAMSLDLLAGFAGLICLGQALFFALGGYAVGILATQFGLGALAATGLAILLGLVAGFLVGAVVVRVGGVFFIMVTLAVGEMLHAFLFTSRRMGASDGLPGIPRADLKALGLNFDDAGTFALVALAAAFLVFVLLDRLAASPFGLVLRALHGNEKRLRALGANLWAVKTAVFTLAAGITALAGALFAQLNGFVSPDLAHWTVSGQVLIIVILGGLGSIAGPALGAVVVQVAAHLLAKHTGHWMLVLGALFVAVVMFAPHGLFGLLKAGLARGRGRHA